MSQGFKLRYDQLREGDPTKANPASGSSGENEFYEMPGHARNLCLVWPNGKRMFLSYVYLVSGELALEGERNVIILNFSSHSVTLKGYGLEPLFMALLDHFPRFIVVIDARYASSETKMETLITDIEIGYKDK